MKHPPVNLLIVGAAKSGTTTLQRHLASLPGAFFSPVKEPNFHARHDLDPERFSAAFRANHRDDLRSYLAGPDPLPARDIAFVRSHADYARLFVGADPARHEVIGEASTTTLYAPSALASVHEMHPEARILVVLRDPVERMFSHYLMARKYGFTTLPFRDAVEADMAAEHPGWGRTELFFQLGCYAAQLGPWCKVWPANRLRILRTEDLSVPDTWLGLAAWLGVAATEDWAEEAASPSGKANTAGLARFEGLNRGLTASGLKSRLASALPAGVKRQLKKAYYNANAEGLPTLSEADRAWAKALYAEDQQRLAVILKTAG